MAKNAETELRFLIKGHSWKKGMAGTQIIQRYISSHPDRSVRLRQYGDQAFLTIKGKRSNNSSSEYEWPIPLEQAQTMLAEQTLFEGHSINKKRYRKDADIEWKGQRLVWELDEFFDENAPLQIAEIELPAVDSDQEKELLTSIVMDRLPDWIGKHLDTQEDPGNFRYQNSSLSRKPFQTWTEEEKADMMQLIE